MTATVEIMPKALPGPADPILPGGRLIGRDEGDDDRSPRRRWVLAIVAGVALLSLVVYVLLPGSHAKTAAKPTPVPAGRSQATMLIQFSGNLGSAIGSALVAHDTVANDGVVVLVPSDLITQVPGFGSMPFGQALTVGDPAAPRTALSDLVGVSVDSSWTLTPAAFAALVDKVGGITIAVNRDVTKTVDGVTNILVPAGQQKLGGTAVVEYASFLADGETEQAGLARFDSVLRQVLAALPRDQGTLSTQLASLGAGSASSLSLTNLAAFLHNLAADNTQNALSDQLLPVIDLQAGGQQSSSTLDTAKTAALVKSQLASSVPTTRAVSSNRVYVQNQVGTPGLGESTRAKLQRAGYQYINGQNTPDMPNTQAPSVVLIFGQTSAQIAEGQAVAAALGLPASDVKINSVGFTAADVIVKLGVDYTQ
jgi:anionic cell wall polymer biosynthesis LytR-Cps2A-Psr (LCP) family protein